MKRLRGQLDLNGVGMAESLGITHTALAKIEAKASRTSYSRTIEAILRVTGYRDEEQLDRAWQRWEFPADLEAVKRRAGIEMTRAMVRRETLSARLVHTLRWLAKQPPDQGRKALAGLSAEQAWAAVERLMELVREERGPK